MRKIRNIKDLEMAIGRLLKKPDKEKFKKHFEVLTEKNKRLVKEGNKSQIPKNDMLLHRFTI